MANVGPETPRRGMPWSSIVWAAGVCAVVPYAFHATEDPTAAWTHAGNLLRVGGFVVAALLLARRGWRYGRARRPSRWLSDQRRRLRRVGRGLRRRWHRVLAALGLAEEDAESQSPVARTAEATAEAPAPGISRGPPPERDLEERVDHLEERAEHQLGLISEARKEARRAVEELEDRLHEEQRNRRKAERRLKNDLKGEVREAEVGSLHWEYVALGWFVAGFVMTTWAGVLPDLPVPG